MKTIMYFFLTVLAALFAIHETANNSNIEQNNNLTNREIDPVISNSCLALTDAEKILGQTAEMTESSSENINEITKVRCTYTADVGELNTSGTSNLYYLLEDYKDVDSSQKVYSDILKQNENMEGIKNLNEIGDQAFLHTDNENFLLIISRKNNKILRLKVNKLTSLTSLDELLKVSKSITSTF